MRLANNGLIPTQIKEAPKLPPLPKLVHYNSVMAVVRHPDAPLCPDCRMKMEEAMMRNGDSEWRCPARLFSQTPHGNYKIYKKMMNVEFSRPLKIDGYSR